MMKLLVLALFAACVAAAPANENVYIDVAMNILRHPSRGRIAGGKYAEVNQFPHQVSIRWSATGQTSHICGGSIIGEKTILTAGHCHKDYGSYDIVLGLLKHRTAEPIVIPLSDSNWIVHKNYPGGGVVSPYDIALIVLDRKILFSEAINKIELGREDHTSIEFYNKAIVSGWGLTSSWPVPSNELKYVEIDRIPNLKCFNDLKRLLSGRNPPLDNTMICTSNAADGNLYAGACAGDSGGCLFVEDNGIRYQIGVVSWGIGVCGTSGAPSVYTKTPSYNDWIRQHWNN